LGAAGFDDRQLVAPERSGAGHKVYAIKPLLEHITAGMQYVLGDLQADDRPSVAGAK
jgi:hypothetical protein